MSPFPESGRSDRQKLGEISVRLRPQAATHLLPISLEYVGKFSLEYNENRDNHDKREKDCESQPDIRHHSSLT